MAGYQRFLIKVGKLRNSDEAKEVLNAIGRLINLHCDIDSIDENFRRENQWGYFPAIEIKRRNGYFIEVAHVGYYSKGLRGKLATLKNKLKERFKNASIKYLNIEELKAI